MSAPAVLFGVDLVEVDRVARALSYSGRAYHEHVTAPHEHALDGDESLATAATVAVKECLVKAVGGRPAGFTWHDFAAVEDTAYPARRWAGPLLDAAVPEVEAATSVRLTRSCTYAVRGASRSAALSRLGPGRDRTLVHAAARWGHRKQLVVALAILTANSEGAP